MQRTHILVFVFLTMAVPAFACHCTVSANPPEWYKVHHGQPTFVGVAVSVENISDVVRQGGGKPLLDGSGKPIKTTVQRATFQVEEAFEGIKNETIEVYGSGTTCDFHFAIGTRYLVYGWNGVDGRIRSGLCTRTAPVAEAAEDLKFLRTLKHRRALR
jgi:hypothetical protein